MNFSFADLNGAILNMAPQGLPKSGAIIPTKSGAAGDPGSAVPGMEKFEEKLSQVMSKTEKKNVSAVPKSGKKALDAGETAPDTAKTILENIGNKKGYSFLAELKQLLLKLSGNNLENVAVDEKGLEALKKLLEKAGFSKADVDDLMGKLEEKLKGEGLVLADFMDELFDLPLETGGETSLEAEIPVNAADIPLLDTSAVPVLESMLTSMGLEPAQVDAVLAAASMGEQGVNLNVVIEKLQELESKTLDGAAVYKVPAQKKSAFELQMTQLGLEIPPQKAGETGLTDFIAALEKLKTPAPAQASIVPDQGQAQAAITEKPADILDMLLKSLTLDTPGKAAEAPADYMGGLMKDLPLGNQAVSANFTELSLENMKGQYKYEMMVGEPEAKGRTSLSTVLETMLSGDANGKMAKELAALAVKQGDGSGEIKAAFKDAALLAGQSTPQSASQSDDNLVSFSSLKQGSGLNNSGISKPGEVMKNLPTHVTHQVSKGILRAVNQGENTLKISLKPPELGRLFLTIDNVGNSMKVSIIAESQAAKDMIAANVSELKSALAGSGISLDQFDVDMNSDFRQSMANAGNQAGMSGKDGKNGKSGSFSGEDSEGTGGEQDLPPDAAADDGSLHFVA